MAIKQLGSNGGGFLNANSAHPFENPSPVSNFVELYTIVVLPFALAFAFGTWWATAGRAGAVFSVIS